MLLTPYIFREACIKAQEAAVVATTGQIPKKLTGGWMEIASLQLRLENHRELKAWLLTLGTTSQWQIAPGMLCYCRESGMCDIKLTSLFNLPLESQHIGYEAALRVFTQEAGISGSIRDMVLEGMPGVEWPQKKPIKDQKKQPHGTWQGIVAVFRRFV